MPPANPLHQDVVGNNHDADATTEQRSKHIEVCVRLRPLAIQKEPSNSFFEKQARAGSLRKAQLPRGGGGIPTSTTSRSSTSTSTTKTGIPSRRPPPVPPVLASTADTRNQSIYAWKTVGTDTVTQSQQTDLVQGRTHSYTLDRVYGPDLTTRHLYDNSVSSLVQAAMDGYHSSILAYGQTSTGKTHTMTGTAAQPGIIPLAVRECFACLQRQAADQPREYLLRVSYLEVYKEHIRDLLAESAAAPPVRLFDSADGLIIRGLREEVVTSPEQVFAILAKGEARRQVGATHMNMHSSRSHVMVRLWIESISENGNDSSGSGRSTPVGTSSPGNKYRPPSPSASTSSLSDKNRGVRVSTLSLVDLAGSESVRLSGSATRSAEGQYINKSLMTLGQVVHALSEDKKSHVPYRDSKLTRLLQPSLSGNAQVVLVCCISPVVSHIEESHNTFKFATRAKKIPQKATIQENADEKTLLQSYREEIEDLRLQLKEARDQQEVVTKETNHSSVASATPEISEDEIIELAEAIQTMEKLILKSKPNMAPQQPEDLLDSSDGDEFTDDDEENLLALMYDANPVGTTPSRRVAATDKNLHSELSRVQGLLGSVLKKRQMVGSSVKPAAATSDTEVESLRAQLFQQEVTTSLRTADSSFLQKQLEEKDDLLQEVSKILEAVEHRQSQLEAENAALRMELRAVKGKI